VINPLTAWSQAIGGMIMGLSTASHEEGVRDPVSGGHINADLAGYHIAAHSDVPDVEADFVPDYEPGDPSGIKGVGEISTVGTAAAIAKRPLACDRDPSADTPDPPRSCRRGPTRGVFDVA
jgi:xanthine dehydrogenase YagR molybdenum-binding subunit